MTIPAEVFDEDTMCRPYLLIPRLPKFPEGPWSRIKITRTCDATGQGTIALSATNEPLPEIQDTWHHNRVDVLSLEQIKDLKSNVHEVLYNGKPAISKIAAFEWDVPRLERETWAYSILDEHQRLTGDQISPKVLGHLTECGRIIGLLLERQEGRFASIEDLPDCEATVRKLHEIGLIHGDVNRYNFIVNKEQGGVTMVDFEHATAVFSEEDAEKEIQSLESELNEDTGRGGPPRLVE
jgi:hypothetical protein